MIRLTGTEDTSEYAAGLAIRDALKAYWPTLEDAPEQDEFVLIACGAKLAGYRVQDFDVILCARFRQGRRFAVTRPVRAQDGTWVTKQFPIHIPNLLVAIEVKDHDANGVRILNNNVMVKYKNGWSNATQQNNDQVHALRDYFRDHGTTPYVRRLLMMQGLPSIEVEGALPRQFNAADFFTEIASFAPILGGREPLMSSCDAAAIEQISRTPVFGELKPTSLDRRRMDRIVSKRGLADEWFSALGEKLLTLRGRGGTGKTVLLLQAAWRAYDEEGARTLLLTYNVALVADIRRTMALMNIPGSSPESGITVTSIMSFIMSWMGKLETVPASDISDLKKYEDNCKRTIEFLQTGAVSPDDIRKIKEDEPEKYAFDYVMADESQDWPQSEAEILKFLYPYSSLATADGVDQLMRGQRCDWQKGVPEDARKVVKLRRCLRMKANLAAFANGVAREAQVHWDTEPNPDGAGGRVLVLPGTYIKHPEVQAQLVAEAKGAGNDLIDFLICVPPSDVARDGEHRHSGLGAALTAQGFKIWDATDTSLRRDFARSTDTLRVVQYQSCRGLEGWTVIAEHLDLHWQYCFDTYLKAAPGADDLFKSPEDGARNDAWLRTLIPLTRSIDTLVITLSDPKSPASQIILKVAGQFKDFAECPGPARQK